MSTRFTLFRFGFRQTLKGAIIIGLLAGFMLALQGVAYQKAYSTSAAREKFAVSLSAAPGLGFLYGDPHDLYDGTPGYMVYRVLGFMGVVTSVWALMGTTKMLRGAEEDGRFEVIRAGATTARRATMQLTTGFAAGWLLALLLSLIMTMGAVHSAHIGGAFSVMLALNVAIFLPGLLFGGVGVLTSQLGLTRGRALLFGIVPIGLFFLIRGMGNTNASLHWLLYCTPFGWAQLIDPLHGPEHFWLYSFVILAIAFVALGVWFSERDYGSSIIKASTVARSHFALLRNPWQLALRQSGWFAAAWAAGAFVMVGIIAGLANTAVNSLQDAGNLTKTVHALGGGAQNLKVAFVGAGLIFMAMVLLLMVIALQSRVRRDEAKQYLDSILLGPERRSVWLTERLLLNFGTILAISLFAGLLVYGIASAEHIPLSFGKVLATSICVVGTGGFLVGLGALLYGFVPRLGAIVLYAVVVWSFLIDLLASATHLSSALLHSSLFQYTSFNLTQWPSWPTFTWLMALGAAMAVLGVAAFSRRDIITE